MKDLLEGVKGGGVGVDAKRFELILDRERWGHRKVEDMR